MPIKFEGKLSDNCVMYKQRAFVRFIIIAACLDVIVISAVALILKYALDARSEVVYILLGMMAVLVLMVVFYALYLTKPRMSRFVKMTVTESYVSFAISPKPLDGNIQVNTQNLSFKRIRKLIKVGECYYVLPKFGFLFGAFSVEKCILRDGTVEDFEKIFIANNIKIDVKDNVFSDR